jgi:hypothetical protein
MGRRGFGTGAVVGAVAVAAILVVGTLGAHLLGFEVHRRPAGLALETIRLGALPDATIDELVQVAFSDGHGQLDRFEFRTTATAIEVWADVYDHGEIVEVKPDPVEATFRLGEDGADAVQTLWSLWSFAATTEWRLGSDSIGGSWGAFEAPAGLGDYGFAEGTLLPVGGATAIVFGESIPLVGMGFSNGLVSSVDWDEDLGTVHVPETDDFAVVVWCRFTKE